jgi:pimeloyl-ACP methyl ester carboxylesterase
VNLVERGSGAPLVLIPGIQGRWEYMRPAVDALSRNFRVLTFSLCGERASGLTFDPARGLENYVDQVAEALAAMTLTRATICGVSFGGLVAIRFASSHAASTEALILASTPGPGWHMRPRHQIYARLPWILGPLFVAESPWRLRQEFKAAFPEPRSRRAFSRGVLRTIVAAPLSLPNMAMRARLMSSIDVREDCARITAPTLVVTGERDLDHVVPTDGSSEYVRLIPHARAAVIDRTGHLGSVTRPDAFAATVRDFTNRAVPFADRVSSTNSGVRLQPDLEPDHVA